MNPNVEDGMNEKLLSCYLLVYSVCVYLSAVKNIQLDG